MDDQSENSGHENAENSENDVDENPGIEDAPEGEVDEIPVAEAEHEETADDGDSRVAEEVPDSVAEQVAGDDDPNVAEVEENTSLEIENEDTSNLEPRASFDMELEQLLLDVDDSDGALTVEDENIKPADVNNLPEDVFDEEVKDEKAELRCLEDRFAELEVEPTNAGNEGGDQGGPVSKPKYKIKEFIESASNLKFEVANTNTTFKLFLPTLKKIVEIPEWEKATLKREQPLIRQAMQRARERSRDYLNEMTSRDNRMIVSEARHIINYERAQRMKAQVLERRRGCVKDLTEPPQRCDPRQSFGIKRRPTEYPPMPALYVNTRPKDNKSGARLRCARERYIKRSDDTWLHSEQLKLIRAAERLERCNKFNEKFATPPQEHNPWVLSPKPRKKRPSIPMPLHRY